GRWWDGGWWSGRVSGGSLGAHAVGAPHDLVFVLLLLPLAQHDALDDGALLRREVRQVRHVGHRVRGGGRPRALRGPAAMRCCARGATLRAPLRPEVYLIMPDGPMARARRLTSARLLIAPLRPPPPPAPALAPDTPLRCVSLPAPARDLRAHSLLLAPPECCHLQTNKYINPHSKLTSLNPIPPRILLGTEAHVLVFTALSFVRVMLGRKHIKELHKNEREADKKGEVFSPWWKRGTQGLGAMLVGRQSTGGVIRRPPPGTCGGQPHCPGGCRGGQLYHRRVPAPAGFKNGILTVTMNSKKLKQNPSLAYTSHPDYRKPPQIANPHLQCLGAPHIDSFNFMATDGIKAAIADIIPVEFELPNGQRIKITIDEAAFAKPLVPMDVVGVKNQKVLPTECRQRAATYKGEFKVRITLKIDGKEITTDRSLGQLPSKNCHLADLSPEELIKHNEHADEWGGYFIIKGHERLARMLLVTRRNYPVAIKRSGWKMRGNLFSDYGVMVRCVKFDQTATNNVLHFLQNGTCKLMFSYQKVMYYAPLILIIKCLECRLYLGRMFRERLTALPPWRSDDEAADFLLRRCLLIHLKEPMDKFNALVEGADAVMVQELQLGGHLYLQVLKERLEALLISVKYNIIKKAQQSKQLNMNLRELQMLLRAAGTLEQRMETFLATGNAPSNHVSLPQYKGLTIVAENINRMRYMSHFKAIHRGSFFMEMRTTEARQLLPDAWGFVCPVTQNPDLKQVEQLPYVLVRCGMAPISAVTRMPITVDEYLYPVFIDGRLVGYFDEDTVQKSTAYLRSLKIKGEEVPISTEIVVIPKQQICGQYPGVFLFTTEARMMRPVINLSTGQLELIGTMEQLQDYAFGTIEIGVHEQPSSVGADARLQSITPTMGTPIHTWMTNAETKLYRLQTPGTPLFRPTHYDNIGLDDYPCGTNAIVAHATSYFCRDNSKPDLARYFDGEKSQYVVSRFHGKEEVFVDSVRLCGDFNSKAPRKACIMLRIQRNPTVGDKFASRAGQKGICSQKWAAEDLPFTESGLIPDILFNPHGFPSRARRDALPLQRERHGNQLLRPPAGVGWLQLLRHRANGIMCAKCGTLLGPIVGDAAGSKETCRLCGEGDLVSVAIPYIFKFFVTQLASVNINVKINCDQNLAIKSS
ncbi:hypothetical protein MSG28_000328, partial [Choristoneura fumiferana]